MTSRGTSVRIRITVVAALTIVATTLTACEPTPPSRCPCTLFAQDAVPVTPDGGDAQAAEVGVRFSPDSWGFIDGVRFYKSTANTGTHIANLWTADGALLATATFTDETGSGWQQVHFAEPVPVAAHGTYIVSYHTDTGHYAADFGFFETPLDNAPLHAPADGTEGNGVYRIGASGFPASTYRATNYWVDPVFVTSATDTTAPRVVQSTPAPNATGVVADTTVTAHFSEPVLGTTITVDPAGDDDPVTGTVTYDAPSSTATFTPTEPLADGTYTVTVADAADLTGNHLAAPVTWTFTVGSPHCPCSLWPPDTTPTTLDSGATGGAEVGTRFSSDTAGYITAIRFAKAPTNTGTHVGHIWNSQGTLLGTATFDDETASGWQTATLANPVAVTPGTSYVASYYAPDGHYAADNGYFALDGVDNRPLHANRDCCGSSNGVYHAGTSAFPASSYDSTNYWVDVVFADTATDTTPPTVHSTTPEANATGVPVNAPVSATFSEPVQPQSIQWTLTAHPDGDGATTGTDVAGTATYDDESLTATFRPTEPLDPTATYTATLTGATDTAGNPMTDPVTWTFTPRGTTSLWGDVTPQIPDTGPNGPLELGTRFATSTPGSITGVRFYKPAAETGAHTASLWTGGGQRLATATFTDETGSGWQQVDFDQPIPISVGGTYVVSYHTDVGHYAADPGYFADAGWCTGPLCAFRDGDGGGNGVFAHGASTYPTESYESTNFWVDPVFTTNTVDSTAPEVLTRAPLPDAADVAGHTLVTAGFSEPIVADTLTMGVTGPDDTPVGGAVTYDAATRVATFTPDTPLAGATTWTVTVDGATDPAGNAMAAPVTWSFTTAEAVPLQGTGGPILVVGDTGGYLGEILRTEGLNLFTTTTPGSLTPTLLADYSLVVLAPGAVSPGTVGVLTDWVTGGGHLIALRPDPQLAGLFGLTPTGDTLTNAYLSIDTATPPGTGLVDEPIQFHGTADRYDLAGATAVATLFASASTPTNAPAVTRHTVGAGSADAFTYDLARSIIETRQGNPAWAGQHRIGTTPIRATDLFYGGAAGDPQADWVDPTRVPIPQADEQQRLLANLITTADATSQPIPRFWYFPDGADAAVLLTGDDHAHGGTAGRFDQLAALDPPGCSVAAWTCPRATSYLFPGTPISNAAAAQYTAEGFDIGLHTSTDCDDFTDSSLDADFTAQLAALGAQLPDIPAPSSNRTHCVVWSNWVGEARAEAAHGIRLDTNYYWWPPQMASGNPGLFTGSGIPMRFADTDGSLIDVYQVPTQITDESDQPEPATIDTLLDNATGPLGYYAVIGVNAHTDDADSATANAVIASARSHGIPIISARQLLTWLDARGRSSFGSLAWSDGTATFTLHADAAAVGLQAMVPLHSDAAPFSAADPGTLESLTVDGAPAGYSIRTVKGLDYAVFTATSGTWTATYGRP